MDRAEIERLTREYGGEFGIGHAQRLLHLVALLSAGDVGNAKLDYDEEIVWLAAHLHDWGGWARWAQPGVEHYDRSAVVAADFLKERAYPAGRTDRVIECIAFHHGDPPGRKPEGRGPTGRRTESILFTDADALDLLGVIGTLRVFSMFPRDLRGAMQALRKYRAMSLAAITLDQSRVIAQARVAETDRLIAAFEEETFGIY